MNISNAATSKSFFSNFDLETIFSHWNSSNTLLELAQALGFRGEHGLTRMDYEYILSLKTRKTWHDQVLCVDRAKERQRYKYISNLTAEELSNSMNFPGIETLTHLALHYLVSPKHGRDRIRKRILALNLPVKAALYAGVFGVSQTPQTWPTRYYEKRIGTKPMVCPECGFEAKVSQQIELDHPKDIDAGPKKSRNPIYYHSKDIQPLCANCHSCKHRDGKRLIVKCGTWQKKVPTNAKYLNPALIFVNPCEESFHLQKEYYLKWVLTGPECYKCARCGVNSWGTNKKLLSLEIHHKDGSRKNALLDNLELLCPNCHKFETFKHHSISKTQAKDS